MPITPSGLHIMDFIGPALAALSFIFIMRKIPEPMRHKFNLVLVAGAGAAYLNGGLGFWEYPYVLFASVLAYKGWGSYKYIGIAWLCHTAWDLVHHFFADPIWPWLATSSIGCAVFDAVIGLWFITLSSKQIDPQVAQLEMRPCR